jgi:hypothetical protein
MKNTSTFLLLISGLMFASCGKKQTTMVSGHVYNYFTGKPVSHMKVMLISADKPGCYEGSSHVYTDEQGYYEVSYEGKEKIGFVKANEGSALRDYTIGDSSNAKNVISGTANTVDLFATEQCSITVVLNNIAPHDDTDLIHFWCYYPVPQNDFLGMQTNTIFYQPCEAMTNTLVEYSVKKNNVVTNYSVHIKVDPYRGSKLTINY